MRKWAPAIERFDANVHVEPNTGCWLWGGSLNTGGYGAICVNGAKMVAHRFAYERWRGPVPPGLELDHLCRQRCCVNPEHLEPVTHRENVRRGTAGDQHLAKTHCPKGHPYSGNNLAIANTGQRRCRACQSESSRRSSAQRRRARGAGIRNADKTHCPKGHPYDERNTHIRNGMRFCRACWREKARLRRVARLEGKIDNGE
jgi:hypothetical protein